MRVLWEWKERHLPRVCCQSPPSEFLVGSCGHCNLEKSHEPRVLDVRPVPFDSQAYVITIGGFFGHGLAKGAQSFGVKIIDRRPDDIHFRGEVVQQRGLRDTHGVGHHLLIVTNPNQASGVPGSARPYTTLSTTSPIAPGASIASR